MTRPCRICGKDFEICMTTFDSLLGNWKQFCCSIECAQIYCQQILESRNPKKISEELQNFDNKPFNKRTQKVEISESKIEGIIEEPKISYTRRRKAIDKTI